jgi:radical SAM protein with 4Fe4S-binding SPASM domain
MSTRAFDFLRKYAAPLAHFTNVQSSADMLAGMPAQAPTPLPRFVQIEPVGQCNLACRMCPVTLREDGPARGAAFMSFETFARILDELPAVTELHLQGMGEPFLHPRLIDMIRHAAGRGITVSTNTNLTALSTRRIEDLIRSGLDTLHVSIDAADAPAYEYIRVGSKLSRVLRNLETLMDVRSRYGGGRPHVALVAVAMRRNLAQFPGLVRLAHRFGIDKVSVQQLAHDFSEQAMPPRYAPMRGFVEAETLLDEDPATVARWFDEARIEASRLGVKLQLPPILPGTSRCDGKRGRERCDWPWRGAYLSYSGEAMPCCMIATPDRLSFGNVARDGVIKVWNSEAYEAFRTRLDSDDPPEICKGCAVYNGIF